VIAVNQQLSNATNAAIGARAITVESTIILFRRECISDFRRYLFSETYGVLIQFGGCPRQGQQFFPNEPDRVPGGGTLGCRRSFSSEDSSKPTGPTRLRRGIRCHAEHASVATKYPAFL